MMKRRRRNSHVHDDGLAEAVRELTRAQALCQLQIVKTEQAATELNKRADERFARHEQLLYALMRDIKRIIKRLPDQLKEKIGFVPPKV